MRIQKFLSQLSICSRREAENLIKQQRVTINDQIINLGALVDPNNDKVQVDNKLIESTFKTKVWAYYKPAGVITSHSCNKSRICTNEVLKDKIGLNHLITVGRLDLNSEGLLLVTNDGDWAKFMMESDLTRTYRVRIFGDINKDKMKKELSKGITIDSIYYKPVDLAFAPTKSKNFWATISLNEGKNREIRKILSHFGLKINRLIRTNYGLYFLGNLKSGDILPIKQLHKISN